MTIADLLRARDGDQRPGLLAGDQAWTWSEVVHESERRARLFARLRRPGRPHIAVLLGNLPEYAFWIGAASLAGAAVVGINPTRRGRELSDDIRHTDSQLLVTDREGLSLLEGVDTGVPADSVLVVDADDYPALLEDDGGSLPAVVDSDLFLLLFTSGTTGAPKAVRCTQGRLAGIGARVVGLYDLVDKDVCYCIMPLFHGNALMALWSGALTVGAAVALPSGGKFSASGFLDDVRMYSATYFTYVGKALTYILATPERDDDADNTLTRGFGNEASDMDCARFEKRFGCRIYEGYGSSEGGAHLTRVDNMPPGSIGISSPPTIIVADPVTGRECPPARFDDAGRLLNADEAIGEMVNTAGPAGFEGYYDNEEADHQRVRNGWYWTGDLAYRDARGYFFFAGRGEDWLRVDGENFASAPVERVLDRFEGVVMSAVYAVPDALSGDQVMATLVLGPETSFSGEDFTAFLAQQADLGTKWAPRFVRIAADLPLTASGKVRKLPLRNVAWEVTDDVWWRPDPRGAQFRRFTPDDASALRAEFAAHGRAGTLPSPAAPPAVAEPPVTPGRPTEPSVASFVAPTEPPVTSVVAPAGASVEPPVAPVEPPVAPVEPPVTSVVAAAEPPTAFEVPTPPVVPAEPVTGWFFCIACGEPLPLPGIVDGCPACGEPLEEAEMYVGPDGPEYDFFGVTPAERCQASDLLFEAGILYRWDPEYRIRVSSDREAQVDSIFGHAEEESETSRALSVLLEAAERLRVDPDDEAGIAELADATGVVLTADPPSGVNRVRWTSVGMLARQLVDLIDRGGSSEDLAAGADVLRSVLAGPV